MGCDDHSNRPYTDCAGIVPISSAGWDTWYGEQLKVIDWAKNTSKTDPIIGLVDFSTGVGVAGHSMGGQATTTSAHHACAKQYDIRAAVLHHSAGCEVKGEGKNAGVNISTIPLAAYTSSGDSCCEKSTKAIYDASPTKHKVYRDLKGSSHLEPVLWPPTENPLLATYTAAWFDIYIKGDKGAAHDLIYGDDPDSLCKAQEMEECIIGG